MDEQRLPFPIHGTRLTGDGDPQRYLVFDQLNNIVSSTGLAADSLNHPLTEDELRGVAGGSGVRIPSYSLLYNEYDTENNKIDPGSQGNL